MQNDTSNLGFGHGAVGIFLAKIGATETPPPPPKCWWYGTREQRVVCMYTSTRNAVDGGEREKEVDRRARKTGHYLASLIRKRDGWQVD